MSGGSHEYRWEQLNLLASSIEGWRNHTKDRKKVSRLLRKLAKICYNIEWIDSSDYSYNDWNEKVTKELNNIIIKIH